MKTNPLVSVVIPVYNTADYLETCIETIIRQTYRNIEIILIDDGSIDNSAQFCDSYLMLDSRISVFHGRNKGLSAARNLGIQLSKGEYICFVDSDDFLSEFMIETLFRTIGKCDMAMCDRVKYFAEDDPVENKKIEHINDIKIMVFDGSAFLSKIYEAPKFIAAWGKLYKRELFDEIRFMEGYIFEDEDAVPQLIHKSKQVCLIEIPLYYYRQRPESIMSAKFSIKNLDIIPICEKRISLFFEWAVPKELYETAVKDYYRHLLTLKKQTKQNGFKESYRLVCKKIKEWSKYGVSFCLIEKIDFLFSEIRT